MKTNNVKLKECVEILDYKRVPLSSKERENLEKIYPYYGAQGIIDYVDNYIFDGNYILVAEDGNNLKTLQQNIALWAKGKFWVNNHAHILGEKEGVDLKYIYYLLNILDIRGYITGSAQPKLNQENLSNIMLSIPEIKVQNKISKILSKIDEKIELNNKINKELENMAKTIYDYWFLQFEFPNDEGKPYKSLGGKMIWNEELKKEIPDGWEVTELDKILKRNKIAILDYKQYYDTIDLSVMPSESINLNKINSSFNFTTNLYELKEGDILFGSIRPYLKKCGISSYNGSFAGTVYSYTPYKDFDFNFCISLMSSNNFFDYAIKVSKGTKMPIVSSEDLMKYKVPYSKEVSLKFNNFLNFKNLFIKNNKENQELISLRDYLLPLLMNGQVGFKD